MITIAIKSQNLFGDKMQYFFEIPEYHALLEKEFLKEKIAAFENGKPNTLKLCYASGTSEN